VDAVSACATAGLGARVGRRAGRVDVIDDAHLRGNLEVRNDAPADVPSSLVEPESALAPDRTRALEKVASGQRPDPAELSGERTRRNVTSMPRSLRIPRCGHEARVASGPSDDLDDELRSLTGEPSPSALLPAANEGARPSVVDDGRPSIGEPESTTRTLGAPSDRPGAG
jgi:hypothetical protein